MTFNFLNIKMNLLKLLFLFFAFGICLSFAPKSFASTQLINGAGASFPYPLYSLWFKTYNKVKPDVQINYQSIGSGGGVRQVIQGTVDFGASDSPMKDSEMAESKSAIHHIPTVLGAVALTFNIPGYNGDIKLTPELLVGIFSAQIKKWNDPRLLVENPSLKDIKNYIIPIRRADGSGTTAVFTEYLSKVSPDWKKKFGEGKAIKWASGLGGKGNEGVTGLVKQNPGAIGYVEVAYAHTSGTPMASIKNKSGQFIKPTLEAISLAANGVKIPDDFRVSITNSEDPKSYPISSFTYLLIPESMPQEKSKIFRDFLKWSMVEGQALAPNLQYAKLPLDLVSRVQKKVDAIVFSTVIKTK